MIWFIIIIVLIMFISIIERLVFLSELKKDSSFIEDYFKRFNTYVGKILERQKVKTEDYEWLVTNVEDAQKILGLDNIVTYDYLNMRHQNILILETVVYDINDIAKGIHPNYELIDKQVDWSNNAFYKNKGKLNSLESEIRKKMFNPFYQLSNGVRLIISIPFEILYSVGILSFNNKNKIVISNFMKVLSVIITIISLLASVMAIILDWNEFIEKLFN